MRQLHVIVHEDAVKAHANFGSDTAKQVLAELAAIKESQEVLELHHSRKALKLHPDMPPPADDLEVFVSGGYTRTCCTMQVYKLRQAGYAARFHPTACCPGQGSLPSTLLRDILEEFPDLYD